MNAPAALREQIEREVKRESTLQHIARKREDLPASYDLIEPEWFSSILCGEAPCAEVIAFTAQAADDQNKGHVRVTLQYNDAGVRAGLPPAVFCKDTQNLSYRIACATADLQRGEVHFYNSLADNLTVKIPFCYHAAFDPQSYNSIIVLEDLHLVGADFCDIPTQSPIERAKSQMEYLATLHARSYGRLDEFPDLASWRAYGETAAAVDAYLDLRSLLPECLTAAASFVPAQLLEKKDDLWGAVSTAFKLHDVRPNAFTHNDAHIRNWYQTADGEMRLGDWQMTARGDPAIDLAFSIATSLSVDDRRRYERELLEYYIEHFKAAGGTPPSMDILWSGYRRFLFIALAWWLPCVPRGDGFQMEPLDEAREIITRVSTAIVDLESFHAN